MSTIIKPLTEVKEDGSQRKSTSLTNKTILKETDAGTFFLNKSYTDHQDEVYNVIVLHEFMFLRIALRILANFFLF